MVEAMLFVCLAMATAPDPCVFMNVTHRELNSRAQCVFYLKQGAAEIQTSEHYTAIKLAMGNPKAENLYIKGECHEDILQEPFVCKDCDL